MSGGGLRLGIDAGGTFTDAVLLDDAGGVVASGKSLTTRFDLAIGIGESLAKLPPGSLDRVVLVSLSTTLTTNAVVEGKGAPVCALLAGYDAGQVKSSGLVELLGTEAVVALAGGHDAAGLPVAELDLEAARAAIRRQAPKVAAFAVSGAFGVRNPAHEIALRDLVRAECDRPVTCGHELASSLGAPRRALTAALNARMIPHIATLIASVEATLSHNGIRAPLMMVKGDGSLESAQAALNRPVGTVLSGPAASVIGACALSGTKNAVVADMGGTTTDIAIVRDGRPELAFDGAVVGGWRPMVEAVRVYAIGLGGDSEVKFVGTTGITVGPRRVVPMSLLGHHHPETLPILELHAVSPAHAALGRFALKLNCSDSMLARCTSADLAAWERLCEGPVDITKANVDDRPLARSVARLERLGMAIYTGFTPTDAAHVLGLSSHWSTAAARIGARIWSRQMRQLYGFGKWEDDDVTGPAQRVFEAVIDAICLKLVEAGLNDGGHMNEHNAAKLAKLLATLALEHRRPGARNRLPVFDLQFADELPLVAVGAPAGSWYPRVSELLGVQLAVPVHGDVANAVGAVLGEVAQRVHLTVTQPTRGVYRAFTPAGPKDFETQEKALDHARAAAGKAARALAEEAGAADIVLREEIDENSAEGDGGERVFFEARVTVAAGGKPKLAATANPGASSQQEPAPTSCKPDSA